MKKTNLFIIGEPKCGTTALFHFLKGHPDVYTLVEKEPNYFCTDIHDESDKFHTGKKCFPIRTKKQYDDLVNKSGDQKIIIDSTTNYAYSKNAARKIQKYNPDAKIIYCVRNPVDFLHSLHSFFLFTLDEEIEDFFQALDAENERKKGKNIPKNSTVPSALFYSERIRFRDHLERYLKIFEKKNIMVIVHEKFRENNKTCFKKVLKFLDIDDSYEPDYKTFNPNKITTSRMRWLRIFANSHSVRTFFRNILPINTYKKLNRLLVSITSKPIEREKLPVSKRVELMGKFRNEAEKINDLLRKEGLINFDLLKLWGYRSK